MNRIVDITPDEAAFLFHRLEVPDCIIEVMLDDNPNVPIPDIEEAIESVSMFVERGQFPKELTDLEKKVLTDVVTGSTWAAVHYMRPEDEQEIAYAAVRTGTRKVSEIVGEDLEPVLL